MALQARRQKGQEPGRERVELKVFLQLAWHTVLGSVCLLVVVVANFVTSPMHYRCCHV